MLLYAILPTILLCLLTQCSARALDPSSPNSFTTRGQTPDNLLSFWPKCPINIHGEIPERLNSDINNYQPGTCGKVKPPSNVMMVTWAGHVENYNRVTLYKGSGCQQGKELYVVTKDKKYLVNGCVEFAKMKQVGSFKAWTSN